MTQLEADCLTCCVPADPRPGIAAALRDRANQEEASGNPFVAAAWRQAADIAAGFVPRPGPNRAPPIDWSKVGPP